jgi:hypothetical protein
LLLARNLLVYGKELAFWQQGICLLSVRISGKLIGLFCWPNFLFSWYELTPDKNTPTLPDNPIDIDFFLFLLLVTNY